jgi:uncharacterized protein YndB with AHSA1/START domain
VLTRTLIRQPSPQHQRANAPRLHYSVRHGLRNETVYQDIVPDRRIVFAYSMAVGDQRISVSLATVEITPPSGEGTRLVYTEQGAFFDGAGEPEGREAGIRELLEKLGEELRK